MSPVRTKKDLENLESVARSIAQIVGPAFDAAGAGFCVLGFEFGEDGWATWVSNVDRHDVIKALREMANNLELGLDHAPGSPGSGITQ